MEFVSGTYSRLSKCCQDITSYFVQGEKTPRTSSGSLSSSGKRQWKRINTSAPPVEGVSIVANFSKAFKEQYFALATAEAQHDRVKEIFQEGEPCVTEFKALVQSSEKALDVLSVAIGCPEEIFIEQVALVYETFHAAYTACNIGKGLAELIFETSKKCDPEATDELYCANPAVFQLLVIRSVKCVQLAAKAALEKKRRSMAENNTHASALQGIVAVPNLPKDTLEQIKAFSYALWHLRDVRMVFEMGGSTRELEALMQSCEEAVDNLTTINCPKELLIDQVAVVYAAFHTVLTHSAAEGGLGKLLV